MHTKDITDAIDHYTRQSVRAKMAYRHSKALATRTAVEPFTDDEIAEAGRLARQYVELAIEGLVEPMHRIMDLHSDMTAEACWWERMVSVQGGPGALPSKWADAFFHAARMQNLRAVSMEPAPAAPPAAAPAVPVEAPESAVAARMAGRAEAVQILLRTNPEAVCDECTSGSQDQTGEWSAYWNESALNKLLQVHDDGGTAGLIERLEGQYFDALARLDGLTEGSLTVIEGVPSRSRGVRLGWMTPSIALWTPGWSAASNPWPQHSRPAQSRTARRSWATCAPRTGSWPWRG